MLETYRQVSKQRNKTVLGRESLIYEKKIKRVKSYYHYVNIKCTSRSRNFKERSYKIKVKLECGCRINNLGLSLLTGGGKEVSK